MSVDLEDQLRRELRHVAGSVRVPARPPLPEAAGRAPRWREPLLAAAAMLLVVAGALGAVRLLAGDDRDPAPAPAPAPTSSATPSIGPSQADAPLSRSAPSRPYVLDRRLHVDGQQVPGDDWWSVRPAGDAWIAARGMPVTWWWGRGPDAQPLPGGEDVTPQLSPGGRYVALARIVDGNGIVTVLDTRSGQDVPGTPADLGPVRPEDGAYVVAVTDDPTVVIRRGAGYVTWSREATSGTLSGRQVLAATPAGVVVADDDGTRPALASLSPRGDLTPLRDLPEHDALAVSPGATWLVWAPLGTLGGEVTGITSLEVAALDGAAPDTLVTPDGWAFRPQTWQWEDDDHVLAVAVDDRARERLVRCRPQPASCVLLPAD